jgi:hypothetical protein
MAVIAEQLVWTEVDRYENGDPRRVRKLERSPTSATAATSTRSPASRTSTETPTSGRVVRRQATSAARYARPHAEGGERASGLGRSATA